MSTRTTVCTLLLATSCGAPVESDVGESTSSADTGAQTSVGTDEGTSAVDPSTTAETSSSAGPIGDSTADSSDATSEGENPLDECTLFVAADGDDAGAGTLREPLATLQVAVDAAVPGATICLRAGTYPTGTFLRVSGTADAPITLRNYPEEAPVIEGTDGQSVGLAVSAGELYGGVLDAEIGWWIVAGLEIRNAEDGIVTRGAHDVVFRGNRIHDNAGMGMVGNGARILVDGNVFADNGWNQEAGWCYPDCANKFHGIYNTGTAYTIVNNVFAGNYAYGVQVAAYPCNPEDALCVAKPEYADARDWTIVNNVFAQQRNRSGIVVWQLGATDSVIRNNIFYRNAEDMFSTQGISFYGCGGGHVVEANSFFGSGVAIDDTQSSGGPSYVEGAGFDFDPLFVDASARDYRLQPNSEAIDAGVPAGAPDHDFDGNPRPQGDGFDLGVYEY